MRIGYEKHALLHLDQEEDVIGWIRLHRTIIGG